MLNRNGRYLAYCVIQLIILVLLVGCSSKSNQAILDLVPLSLQLRAEYAEASVVVELDDRDTLGVTVVDATADELTLDQAAERARSIASFLCENYRSMDAIDRVWVTFENPQDRFMIDGTNSATYRFESGELACDLY